MVHWYKYSDVNEKRNGSKWRFHLNSTEIKRFTRIKRIVRGWNKQMEENIGQGTIIEGFESFYSTNQKSVAKSEDGYVKNLL